MKSSDLMTHPASLDPPPLPLSFNYGLYRSLNFNLKKQKIVVICKYCAFDCQTFLNLKLFLSG